MTTIAFVNCDTCDDGDRKAVPLSLIHIQMCIRDSVMEVLSKKAVVTEGINAGVDNGPDYTESFVDEVFEMMI